jgi:hypothetical protein
MARPAFTKSNKPATQRPVAKVVVAPEKVFIPQMTLAERIPSMTEVELNSLLDNAGRFAKMNDDRKQAQAQELIPLLEAELKVRKSQKADLAVERTKATAAKRVAAKARRAKEKAEQEEDASAE